MDVKQFVNVVGGQTQVEITRREVCPPESTIRCDVRSKKYGASPGNAWKLGVHWVGGFEDASMNPRKKIALQAGPLFVPRVANAVTKNTLRIRAPQSETPLVIVSNVRGAGPQARTNKRIRTGLARSGRGEAEVRGSKQVPVFESFL